MAWMSHVLGVSERGWMVPVGKEGAVTKEQLKISLAGRVTKTKKERETPRQTLSIQTKLSQCELCGEPCSGGADGEGASRPLGQPLNGAGWAPRWGRPVWVDRAGYKQVGKLKWKIILRNRRQGLTYLKLRNCKISWSDQVEIVTSAVRKGTKKAKEAFWKDRVQLLETATLSTTELF